MNLDSILQLRADLMIASGDVAPSLLLRVSQDEIDVLCEDPRAEDYRAIPVPFNGQEMLVDSLTIGGVRFVGPEYAAPCKECDGTGLVERLARGSNDPQTAREVDCPVCCPEVDEWGYHQREDLH